MKTFKILTIISFVLLSFKANAVSMGQILGRVLDKQSQLPVPFAEIVFENRFDRIVVQANESGYYYADHLPTGKYEIRILFNTRTFIMKQVPVYDRHSTEVNFSLNSDENLPETVELKFTVPLINSTEANDVRLSNSDNRQPTRSLNEALETQRGVDVINGKLYVKGSDDVKFFIDGTPVMGQPTFQRGW